MLFKIFLFAGLIIISSIRPQNLYDSYFYKSSASEQSLTFPIWITSNPVSKVLVLDKTPPTAGSLAAGNASVPDTYLPDPAIDTLLLMLQMTGTPFYKTDSTSNGLVTTDGVVILKCSFQWDFRNTTSTDRIKGVIWRILNHPAGFTGEVLVGDNTQWASTGEDDNNSEDINQSILDVINTFHSKGYPVHLFEWKNIMYNVVAEYSAGDMQDGFTYNTSTKVSYPKFKSPAGNYISLKYGIWNTNTSTYNYDRMCIIDFPVLKCHGWTGATLGIKNWVGMLTVAYQNERFGGNDAMHFNYFFSSYALIARVMAETFPKLTIIDGEWANPEKNYGNNAVFVNALFASTDPFAVSWYAAKYGLTPVAWYPEITNPDLYVGYNSYGTFLLTQYTWMKNNTNYPITINPSQMSVYSRENLLPVELSMFYSEVFSNKVVLRWRTETEVNNYGFDIERNNVKIGFVSGNGNSNSPKNYVFEDYSIVSGVYSYRLKQLDTDGSFTYSYPITIRFNIPTTYALAQNYPNPFNISTIISYSIPISGNTSLKVYDVLGKEVMVLTNSYQQAGIYETYFNSGGLKSGIYIYKLESGSFQETKKMILLK